MTLSSYDLKAKLEEKTTDYLKRSDQQDYLVVRRQCLALKPIQAVVETLRRELDELWHYDILNGGNTLKIKACETQKTLDSDEEKKDKPSLETERQELANYQYQLNGNFFHSGILAQKKAKEDKIKQKQSKIRELSQQMRHTHRNISTLLAENNKVSNRIRELQQELTVLSKNETALVLNISNCERRIQQYELRANARTARKRARQAAEDPNWLQLSTPIRESLTSDIAQLERELGSKRKSLLENGTCMSYGVYLSILEGQLASKCLADQSALSQIIEQVHLYLRCKEVVAEAQSRLDIAQQHLRLAITTRYERQQDVAEVCRKIGLQVEDSSSNAMLLGFQNYYTVLGQNDVALKIKLQSIPLYIGVSFVLGLALGVATVFAGTAFGTLVPIVLGIAAFLSVVVGIERSVRYCKLQETISKNDHELTQYAKAHEYILLTIPLLSQKIDAFNADIRGLSDRIAEANRTADAHFQNAQSVTNVAPQPSAPPAPFSFLWTSGDDTSHDYNGEPVVAELVAEDSVNGYTPLDTSWKR